jgi:hypothetical protein
MQDRSRFVFASETRRQRGRLSRIRGARRWFSLHPHIELASRERLNLRVGDYAATTSIPDAAAFIVTNPEMNWMSPLSHDHP